jgi:hypothetical protein
VIEGKMTKSNGKHSSDYLERLEAALKASGTTQTAFGYMHFGDPGFFTRMRKGVHLRRKMVEKIENVLDTFSQ